jgi:hypothetical protein
MNISPVADATITEDPPAPTYEARRAIRVTRRQEKEAKRQYEHLKGVLRSQLRKQVDQIAGENGRNLIFALLNGGKLQVAVSIEMPQTEPGADTQGTGTPDIPSPPARSLIEVVRA